MGFERAFLDWLSSIVRRDDSARVLSSCYCRPLALAKPTKANEADFTPEISFQLFEAAEESS